MAAPGWRANCESAKTDFMEQLAQRRSADEPVRVVLGAMNFGKRTDAAESERVIRAALDRGVRFFDTANVYNAGESERIVGRALATVRASCVIATKVGLARTADDRAEGLAPETVLAAADASLKRLGTEYIDVYYLHAPDHATPIERTLDAVKALIERGKVRAWGVSNYAAWQILEMNRLADERAMPRPAISQVLYNALIRELEVEYFAFARRYPIHTTVYNPLAGGLLAGRVPPRGEPPKGSRFDSNPMYQRRYLTDAMHARCAELREVAEHEGLSLLDLAYAWVAGRTGVDSVLVGPASVEHLDAALAGLSRRLSPELHADLDARHRAWLGTDTHYVR